MKKPTIAQQISRLNSILNHPVTERCSCGLRYVPLGGGNCPDCKSMLVYDYDEEFEQEFEMVSFEEVEL